MDSITIGMNAPLRRLKGQVESRSFLKKSLSIGLLRAISFSFSFSLSVLYLHQFLWKINVEQAFPPQSIIDIAKLKSENITRNSLFYEIATPLCSKTFWDRNQ